MTEEITMMSLALQLQRQGDRLETMGDVLKAHLTECADARKESADKTKAANERLGRRIWQVCIILLTAMSSIAIYTVEHQKDVAKSTAAVVRTAKAQDDVNRDRKLDDIQDAVNALKLQRLQRH